MVKEILQWYCESRRNLPWRKTHVPYKILVSEVMLQQTQVDRVVSKYKEFLKAFPTSKKLAQAKTSDVIKIWRGLGYNRRALFLQKTAQTVHAEYKGKFPCDLELLKKLPGVGDYTARAILSFAFDLPVPVLDTNHRKFYRRFLCDGRDVGDRGMLVKAEELVSVIASQRRSNLTRVGLPRLCQLADPRNDSELSLVYHWNQALMDFMTAVAQKDSHPLVQSFIQAYPDRIEKKKKNAVPFKETDRFIRGRIIDVLREKEQVTLAFLAKILENTPKERIEKVVQGLAKDQLIVKKGKTIVLP